MTSDENKGQMMRLPEVLKEARIGRSTVYKEMKVGRFPKRRELSEGTVGWRRDDVQKWIDSRKEKA